MGVAPPVCSPAHRVNSWQAKGEFMNIQQAMEQVRGAVAAYLSRDGRGLPRIPVEMQRPLFLVGPPGVGKTAIVAQIAAQMGINFVSYAMTHHTRQSALGLPFIVEREFGGVPHQVSEYTMSEIIGAVHMAVERTGEPRGILFLDEVNCVSETLAPAMLQFLQYKTFGQHALPEGWVVVCAGNPPEYNRAAREFDPATLDRLKRIPVEPDVRVWLDYASAQGMHPAVMAYLEAKPQAFYLVRADVEGMRLVTARGWEDLSRILLAYEAEGIAAGEDLVAQYLQDARTAQDFAVFLELFATYRQAYDIAEILDGADAEGARERAAAAPFGERMAVMGLLADAVQQRVRASVEWERALRLVRGDVLALRPSLDGADAAEALRAHAAELARAGAGVGAGQGAGDAADGGDGGDARVVRALRLDALDALGWAAAAAQARGDAAYPAVRDAFNASCRDQAAREDAAGAALENAFGFLDGAFGAASQEAAAFTARLAADPAITRFVAQHGADAFLSHNRALLVADRAQELLRELDGLDG